jgi:hypothetical protein
MHHFHPQIGLLLTRHLVVVQSFMPTLCFRDLWPSWRHHDERVRIRLQMPRDSFVLLSAISLLDRGDNSDPGHKNIQLCFRDLWPSWVCHRLEWLELLRSIIDRVCSTCPILNDMPHWWMKACANSGRGNWWMKACANRWAKTRAFSTLQIHGFTLTYKVLYLSWCGNR